MNRELLERLRGLLRREAVSTGKVPLSSGKVSNYYVDCKMVTLSAEGAYLVARLILDELGPEVDAVGGPMIGADPVAGAIAAVSYSEGRPVTAFIVRKEPKKHGKMKWVEGPLPEGARVVIVDDVITTGASVLKAIEGIEAAGCKVVKVIALVDRVEGGRQFLASKGYVVETFFTPSDLGIQGDNPGGAKAEAARGVLRPHRIPHRQ